MRLCMRESLGIVNLPKRIVRKIIQAKVIYSSFNMFQPIGSQESRAGATIGFPIACQHTIVKAYTKYPRMRLGNFIGQDSQNH
jgi:hypothetical protein